MDLEEVWRIREEDIYPALFGPNGRGIFPLPYELFAERLGQEGKVDPRWLHYGVFEFAPTPTRTSWLYVTSGYSNPWETEPENYNLADESGSGIEFTFETTEQGNWAIQQLQNMLAFDIVLAAGRFPGKHPLTIHDRIPLRSPINGDPASLVCNLVLTQRPEGPSEFVLPSGRVELLRFVGFTDAELAFAKEHGSPALLEKLQAAGFDRVTDPWRMSVV